MIHDPREQAPFAPRRSALAALLLFMLGLLIHVTHPLTCVHDHPFDADRHGDEAELGSHGPALDDDAAGSADGCALCALIHTSSAGGFAPPEPEVATLADPLAIAPTLEERSAILARAPPRPCAPRAPPEA